ncbi:MAG: hypothetical protein WDN04_07485 [Rhodospirillales bacterium]
MKNNILRLAIVATGAVLLLIALVAWFDPARIGARLGIGAIRTLGMASLRADLGAFFATAGLLALAAGVRRAPGLLTAPLLLVALALAGRFVALAATPFESAMLPPMIAEAVMVALFASGRFCGPRHEGIQIYRRYRRRSRGSGGRCLAAPHQDHSVPGIAESSRRGTEPSGHVGSGAGCRGQTRGPAAAQYRRDSRRRSRFQRHYRAWRRCRRGRRADAEYRQHSARGRGTHQRLRGQRHLRAIPPPRS